MTPRQKARRAQLERLHGRPCPRATRQQVETLLRRVTGGPCRFELHSDQPGVQLYTGNFLPLPDGMTGKGGAEYGKQHAFCLETQHFPDSINQPSFPSVVLEPGKTFRSTTIYRFSAK